jgi:membrane-bound serine protease (ClpP class)
MDAIISDPFFSWLLLAIGVALIFLEVFIPSGGIIGIVALASLALGIYGFFSQGQLVTGFLTAIGSVVFIIAMFSFMLRRISLKESQDADAFTSVDSSLEEVMGRSGIARSPLRPAGVALIDGKRIDVVAVSGFIEKDKEIRVIEISGNRVVVIESPETDKKSQELGNG